MNPTKKQAHIAGLLYTLVAVTAPIGLMYVPGKLFDPANATATADHLRASASLPRLGIGSELFHQAIEVFLVLALYNLFEPVYNTLARQMALLGLIPIPIVFLNVLNEVAALILSQGPTYLSVFDKPQLDAMALFFTRLHSGGIQIAAVFWGLWLFPFGLLALRSGFIPKLLGVLVMLSGLGYLLDSFSYLVVPSLDDSIGNFSFLLELGEPVMILWLLIFGARTAPAEPRLAAG